MKRFYFIFLLLATLTNFIFTTNVSGSSKLKTEVRFNQQVYQTHDPMAVKIMLTPASDVADVRVALRIGEKNDYTFSRTMFLGNLKKDEKKEVTFSKNNAKSFGLDFGKNNLTIDITSKKNTVYKFTTEVGLAESEHKQKLRVILAVSIADKPHLDLNKNILDTTVQNILLPKLEQYLNLYEKDKAELEFIFSPMLAETLNEISGGYTLTNKNKVNFIPASSPSLVKARKIIKRFANTSLILSAYSTVVPKRLDNEAFDDQLKEGKLTLSKVFGKENISDQFVLFPNKFFGPAKERAKYWLATRHEENVFYLPAKKGLLDEKDKQSATMRALANLTVALNNNSKIMVLITDDMINPAILKHFIKVAKNESWLDFKSLKVPYAKKYKPLKTKKVSSIKKLQEARSKYFLFKEALVSDSQIFDQAKMAIILAEDKNTSKKAATQLAEKAFNLLDKELRNLSLQLSPLTLTGKSGKLPIKISNGTSSKFKVKLQINTREFALKSKTKTVEINPKENLISIPVKVLKSGRHKVMVTIKAGDKVIAKDYLIISTSLPGTFWYYISAILLVMLLLVVGAFYVRERRSRGRTKKH